jgi:hypothetical protein
MTLYKANEAKQHRVLRVEAQQLNDTIDMIPGGAEGDEALDVIVASVGSEMLGADGWARHFYEDTNLMRERMMDNLYKIKAI